jgi:hypothetical protein
MRSRRCVSEAAQLHSRVDIKRFRLLLAVAMVALFYPPSRTKVGLTSLKERSRANRRARIRSRAHTV